MSKFPTIPEFNDLQSVMVAMRAMKQALEQLAGLRQGASLGAPSVYLQATPPAAGRNVVLAAGDFWIDPAGPYLSYWSGSEWKRVTA